jgi:outer membrane cobalamin receptor
MQHVFAGERLMTKFISVFLSTICASATAAEFISGTVVDPLLRPVPGALIQCGSANATTGIDGRFKLSGVDGCDASIQKTGFAEATTHLTSGEDRRIQLTLAELSERVIVSATRTTASLEESGVSSTVWTRADIAGRQFPPVLDLLRDVPGMNVVATGRRGAYTGVFMRGANSTGTLFLLDGVPLNDPGGQIDLANLTTAGVERIEVVRGPESALFGAEAASGVVQLFSTRGDPESDRPRGSISYERGSFQTDRWRANLNGGLANRIDYSLTADQLHTVGMFANDYYRVTTGAANIGFRLARTTTLGAIYREYDSIAGNPNAVGFGVFDSDANGENRDSTLAIRVDDARTSSFVQRFSFGYHRLRNRFNDAVTDGPYAIAALVRNVQNPQPRVYLVSQVPPAFPPSQVPPGQTLVIPPDFATTLYPFPGLTVTDRKDFDYQGTWTHRGGALVFGYEHEDQGGLISGADVVRRNNGGFVHEQYTIGRRLFLTGGARIENSSTFGNKFAPRGSVTLKLTGEHGPLTSTYVRFSAGRGITEPSLLENFARESFYVGNPALKPEKLTGYDLGVVQEWFGRRLRGEVTAFRNSFQDLIVFDSSQNPSTWNNIDRSWARGLEAVVTARPWKFVELNAAYTRLNTKITRTNSTNIYTGVGQELPRRPRNSGTAWISIAPRRWTLLVGGRVVGERQDSDFVFGITRNPGYGNVYASGSYQLTSHVAPFLRIDNLMNEHYQEVLGYPALTRNAMGGVRVSW